MTPRENLLSLYRRQGYEAVPVGMHLCPSLVEEFNRRYPEAKGDYLEKFGAPYRIIFDPGFAWNFDEVHRIPNRDINAFKPYYPEGFAHEVKFDGWGVAHEAAPGAHHMTRMHHPLKDAATVQDLENYPWPNFKSLDFSYLKPQVEAIQQQGNAVFVWAECTVWETSWYLRSMDNLFVDMGCEDPMATYLLDKVTDFACFRARKFAQAGVDILGLGDDIGMQQTIMMSVPMYQEWLKPRLKRVIDAAREVKPDILISYHSCGFIEPFINELIEAGVDILNPVQPECMDFSEIHWKYGNRIAFNGTLGTQKLMPRGTPEQVREEVVKNLTVAGPQGGLFCCPTHMLEPEVPWANIEAYLEACKNFLST